MVNLWSCIYRRKKIHISLCRRPCHPYHLNHSQENIISSSQWQQQQPCHHLQPFAASITNTYHFLVTTIFFDINNTRLFSALQIHLQLYSRLCNHHFFLHSKLISPLCFNFKFFQLAAIKYFLHTNTPFYSFNTNLWTLTPISSATSASVKSSQSLTNIGAKTQIK